MTGGNVSNFVGHHAGQLGFIVSGEDQARINVEETAGQREGINVVRINDLDDEWHLRIGVADQVLAQPVDVFADSRISDQLGGGLDLQGVVLAHRDLLFQTVPVSEAAAAASFSASYGVDVAEAAIVISLDGASGGSRRAGQTSARRRCWVLLVRRIVTLDLRQARGTR